MIRISSRFSINRNLKFGIAILALFQIGCLKYDELIFMNEDGSGELVIRYQSEQDMKFENLYFPTDIFGVRENIKRNFAAEGLSNAYHEIRQKDDFVNVYMNFMFEGLDALNSATRFEDERFENSKNEEGITLRRFIYLDESKLDRGKLLFKSGLRSLFSRKVLSEIRFRFQWIVPGMIVDSNASLRGDKNRAIWNITLDEILKERSVEFYVRYVPKE